MYWMMDGLRGGEGVERVGVAISESDDPLMTGNGLTVISDDEEEEEEEEDTEITAGRGIREGEGGRVEEQVSTGVNPSW